MRGGKITVSKRYAKANNPNVSGYDPDNESNHIMFYDTNNLCGWAMSQPLPYSDFKLVKSEAMTASKPLNLLSASSVNLHGLADSSIFHNNLRVMLSPLKSPVLRKYSNPFKRPGMYPSISKCNAKRCNCCMHLCTNSTVTSSVNGRKFSVVNNSDLD